MAASAPITSHTGIVSYMGRGIYDINEMARLLQKGRTRVEGWTRPRLGSPALLTPELDGLFSFWDLLSLRVIAELTRRGVPRGAIATGAEHLAVTLGTNRPFAHQGLATVGSGFFAEVAGDWQDAGQRGQLAFQSVIEPLLEPITFDGSHMASIWRPHAGVWINPGVQAGTPCVDGTRVPTHLLGRLLGLGEPDEDDFEAACDDYRLTADQMKAALDYEVVLAA